MTDNEIVKALECCINDDDDLFACGNKGCVFMKHKTDGSGKGCDYYMMKSALSLINRLQAENENYSHNVRNMTESIYKYQKTIVSQKTEIERLKRHNDILQNRISRMKEKEEFRLRTAKVETVEEFAERLKEKANQEAKYMGGFHFSFCVHKDIDSITKEFLKEMEGEEDGTENGTGG